MNRLLLLASLAVITAAPVFAQNTGRRDVRSRMDPTLARLNQLIPELSYDSVPFETVMLNLAEQVGVNLSVRWEALENVGVEREAPVSLRVKGLRFSQALWMVLNAAGKDTAVLAYRMSGDLVIVSTDEDLGKEIITKVYDVADLMVRIENAERPQFQNSQGLGTQGGGGSLFQNDQDQNRDNDNEPGEASPEMEALIRVIQATIAPETWSGGEFGAEGGENAPGRIQAYGNLLIVTNTILVHQQLGGYVSEE